MMSSVFVCITLACQIELLFTYTPANDTSVWVCWCVGMNVIVLPQPRRDVLIAEVVWFFRVQEVPESLYLLLQEDRKSGWLLGAGDG